MKGKRILVTGATSGIGRAAAILLAERGAKVFASGRDKGRLDEVLSALPAGCEGFACDLSLSGSAESLVGAATANGGLDAFVHAAGVCPVCPVNAADAQFMDKAMRVNCYAFQEIMKELVARKVAGRGFSAVAVSSVAASAGWPGGGAYCASKGALSSLARAMAVELAPRGIRVNAVSPSNIKTPLFESITAMKSREDLAALERRQPFGFGSPADVAGPICFLVSSDSAFVTGVDLPVDGGYLAS